jgi:histidine triad (HIT) family protein
MEDCIFCKIVNGKIGSEKVLESNSFIAIKDINPKTVGHTLIISKDHYVTLLDIPNRLGEELLTFSKQVVSKLMDETKAHGFNVIMNNLESAGQIVKHAHIHIIPRKEGDGLKSIV